MTLTIIAADNGINVSADDINEMGATYAKLLWLYRLSGDS